MFPSIWPFLSLDTLFLDGVQNVGSCPQKTITLHCASTETSAPKKIYSIEWFLTTPCPLPSLFATKDVFMPKIATAGIDKIDG